MRYFTNVIQDLIKLSQDDSLSSKLISIQKQTMYSAPELAWKYYGPEVSRILQSYVSDHTETALNSEWFIDILAEYTCMSKEEIKNLIGITVKNRQMLVD